jgi:hypothetical protein
MIYFALHLGQEASPSVEAGDAGGADVAHGSQRVLEVVRGATRQRLDLARAGVGEQSVSVQAGHYGLDRMSRGSRRGGHSFHQKFGSS